MIGGVTNNGGSLSPHEISRLLPIGNHPETRLSGVHASCQEANPWQPWFGLSPTHIARQIHIIHCQTFPGPGQSHRGWFKGIRLINRNLRPNARKFGWACFATWYCNPAWGLEIWSIPKEPQLSHGPSPNPSCPRLAGPDAFYLRVEIGETGSMSKPGLINPQFTSISSI